jgi:hypothetical protein
MLQVENLLPLPVTPIVRCDALAAMPQLDGTRMDLRLHLRAWRSAII